MRWLQSALKVFLSKWTTNLVMPVFSAAPPCIVAAARNLQDIGWFAVWARWLLQEFPSLSSWFGLWPVLLIPMSLGLAWIRNALAAQDLDAKDLLVLIDALDQPVQTKSRRFGATAKEINGSSVPIAGDVFHAITRPKDQIVLLVEAIHVAFQHEVEDGDELKVVLARMENRKLQSFEAFAPYNSGPKSVPKDLKGKESGFNRAAERKGMIIIPDIQKELKKRKNANYARGSTGSDNQGSAICFAVVDQDLDDVPFVISVKYSVPKHFAKSRERRYRFILQRFADRLVMENRLLQLKEATNK